MHPALRVGIAVQIIRERPEEDRTARVAVAEQAKGLVGLAGQVTETDNVAKGLDTVEDTVRPGIRLQKAVQPEILIDPQRIERSCVKAGKEHVYDDQNVKFLVLQAQRHVFVVILELLVRRVVASAEHLIVIIDGRVQEIPGRFIQARGGFGILRIFKIVGSGLVRAEAVDQADPQTTAFGQRLLLFFELAVI